LHFISSAPHSFGIARDSSHRSASNRMLDATDSSSPTATSSRRSVWNRPWGPSTTPSPPT
jgi:hypothetical protein